MKSVRYDTVIIGSGFGGAAAAHALTAAGRRTLIVERGGWAFRDDLDWNQREILIKQRYRTMSPLLVQQYGDDVYREIYPNSVVGGQSVFYGGASLRLREPDFLRWPIGYDELEPYYAKAEQLLGVHGEVNTDPCEPPRSGGYPFPPPTYSLPARRIFNGARKLDYQPFKLPLAINFSDKQRARCIECITCDGFPCKIEAKNDLTATLLKEGCAAGLDIMPGVLVKELDVCQGRVRAVLCLELASGRTFYLEAKHFVVAAGALHTAALLQRSGLGGGCVGRYLMRHCNAVVSMLFARPTNPDQVFHKQLCFTEFYEDMRRQTGAAVGVIQDIYTPAAEVIRQYAPRGLKSFAGMMTDRMQNLLCIAEDDAQRHNRVELAAERDALGLPLTRVTHGYSRDDNCRLDYLTERAGRVLHAAGGLVSYTYKIDSFSHAVGTVRFGNDPASSALDKNCRLRGVDNLHVLDGSFMPTSGGVNPSLTIAANAFRVVDGVLHSE